MEKVIKKLKASTLLEPVIASVVLTIAVSTFSMSLGNVVKMGNASQKMHLQSIMNEIVAQSIHESRLLDEEFEFENFIINKTVTKYNESETIYLLTLKAVDAENNVLQDMNRLIKTNKE